MFINLVQDHDFIVAQYAKTFEEDKEVFPLRQTYWLGCYSADAAPVIENLPPPRYGLIVETPASGDLYQLWYKTFRELIRAGLLASFQSYGWRSQELHDVFDWARAELFYLWDTQQPQEVAFPMSTGHDTLPEAIEYFELCVGSYSLEESSLLECVVLSLCPEDSAPT
jgi:hypothetical protein